MSTVWTVLRHFMQMPCDQSCLVRFVQNLGKSTQIIIGKGGGGDVSKKPFFLWSGSSPAPVSLKTQLWGSCDWLHPLRVCCFAEMQTFGSLRKKYNLEETRTESWSQDSTLLGPSSGSQKPPELPADNIRKWSLISPLSAGIRELTDK